MKTTWKLLVSVLLGGGLSALLPSIAEARGLALDSSSLDSKTRIELQKDIDAARSPLSDTFARVRNVQGVKPEVYSKQRNPAPAATRELRQIGKDALLPMLEALAFDASQTGLTAQEKEVLTLGMLEAVGDIKDPRAASVLSAIFLSRDKSDMIAMAAASGLGKLCRASEVKVLTEHAEPGKARQLAAIYALGECRTEASAKALIHVLQSAKGGAEVEAVRALGTLGSSWVSGSKTPGAVAVRKMASDALIDAFESRASVRKEASRSILKCNDESALPRVRSAVSRAKKDRRTADLSELERLETRIAKQRSK